MKAVVAHFRHISKNGRLDIEDERGEAVRGMDTPHERADDCRFGGSLIDDIAEPGRRREAFNIMLSMPRGTDPLTVQRAARQLHRRAPYQACSQASAPSAVPTAPRPNTPQTSHLRLVSSAIAAIAIEICSTVVAWAQRWCSWIC